MTLRARDFMEGIERVGGSPRCALLEQGAHDRVNQVR